MGYGGIARLSRKVGRVNVDVSLFCFRLSARGAPQTLSSQGTVSTTALSQSVKHSRSSGPHQMTMDGPYRCRATPTA